MGWKSKMIAAVGILGLLLVSVLNSCGGGGDGGNGGGGGGGETGIVAGNVVVPGTLLVKATPKPGFFASLFSLGEAFAISGATPLSGATVQIYTMDASGNLTAVTGVSTDTTDSAGEFDLTGVPEGDNYVIVITKTSGATTVTVRCFVSVTGGDTVEVDCHVESTIAVEAVRDRAIALAKAASSLNPNEVLDILDLIFTILNSGFESLGLSLQDLDDALTTGTALDAVANTIAAVPQVANLLNELETSQDEQPTGTSGIAVGVPGACVAEGKIVFVSDADDIRGELYLADADGTVTHRLTGNTARETNPHFSPDGCKVVFTRDGDIWILNLETGTETNLTGSYTRPDGGKSEEDWGHFSPNPDQVVFQSDRSGDFDVWKASSTDGSGATNLTDDNPCFDGEPDWSHVTSNSPTEKIAYTRNADSDTQTAGCQATQEFGGGLFTEVWIMDTDGTDKTLVATNSSGPSGQPDFAEGSTKLVYWIGPAPGLLQVVTFDTSWAVLSDEGNTPIPDCSHPSFTPGVTAIVYESSGFQRIEVRKLPVPCATFCSESEGDATLIALGNSYDPDVRKP
jgi:Tol biopolymer transport system component